MEQSELQALEPGTTTLADMKQSFGSPISQTYDTQGNLVVNWAYTHFGYMGIGNEQQSLSAIFDEDKVLEKFNVMQGNGASVRLGP